MAVAVAVDATVVRCVLVPAIMSLLGSVGWWLTKWMERATLKFSIEGNEWFAEHETPAPARENVLTDARKSSILVGGASRSALCVNRSYRHQYFSAHPSY